MVFVQGDLWTNVLQPKLAVEYRAAGKQSLDSYLNTTHKFTPMELYWSNRKEYGIQLFFNDPHDEVIFRLKYEIK